MVVLSYFPCVSIYYAIAHPDSIIKYRGKSKAKGDGKFWRLVKKKNKCTFCIKNAVLTEGDVAMNDFNKRWRLERRVISHAAIDWSRS